MIKRSRKGHNLPESSSIPDLFEGAERLHRRTPEDFELDPLSFLCLVIVGVVLIVASFWLIERASPEEPIRSSSSTSSTSSASIKVRKNVEKGGGNKQEQKVKQLPTFVEVKEDTLAMASIEKRTESQIVVMGLYHSGTESVTKLLGDMGIYCGSDRLDTLYELQEVTRLNAELLQWTNQHSLGHRVVLLEDMLLTTERKQTFFENAATFVGKMNQQERPWVIQDSRFALTLPMWIPLLDSLLCVVVCRHPHQAALSLKKTDNYPAFLDWWYTFTEGAMESCEGFRTMLVYQQDLLTHPHRTAIILYNELKGLGLNRILLPLRSDIEEAEEVQRRPPSETLMKSIHLDLLHKFRENSKRQSKEFFAHVMDKYCNSEAYNNRQSCPPYFMAIGGEGDDVNLLGEYLSQHLQVTLRKPREQGIPITQYLQQQFFESNYSAIVPGSMNDMLYDTEVPKELAASVPRLKLIAILQHPIKRLHKIFKERHHSRPYKNFEEFFATHIEEVREVFPSLLNENLQQKEEDERRLKGKEGEEEDIPISTWYDVWQMTRRENRMNDGEQRVSIDILESFYWLPLRMWMQHFPSNQFFVTTPEELETNPISVMNSLTAFLELEPSDWRRATPIPARRQHLTSNNNSNNRDNPIILPSAQEGLLHLISMQLKGLLLPGSIPKEALLWSRK